MSSVRWNKFTHAVDPTGTRTRCGLAVPTGSARVSMRATCADCRAWMLAAGHALNRAAMARKRKAEKAIRTERLQRIRAAANLDALREDNADLWPDTDAGRMKWRRDLIAAGVLVVDAPAPVAVTRELAEASVMCRHRVVPLSEAAPVRPSLARAAREAIREANESDAPVYLEPAFAKALHGMLVEAGL